MELVQSTIASWLQSLPKAHREAFIERAKATNSVIELYVYARFLNPRIECSIADLDLWFKERFDCSDHRKMLIAETERLENDVKQLRSLILDIKDNHENKDPLDSEISKDVMVRTVSEVYGKISGLENQLRSNIVALMNLNQIVETKSLKLEGAESLLSTLLDLHKTNPEICFSLEQAALAIYDDLSSGK